ncbi:hypothetical protein CYMTET_56310 [Cymbomonas tetramitiformis]|uniref:Uncharacterized protein n=1 Tax=Cymbomonas tetramitiformis TaxID=36881 RepID=A0AAE0BCL3_9CHLO|nr:hypothetical protein CYMTET_56310 [Cymbomonas tetramitiformis]
MFKLMFASIRAACFWNLVASGNRNMNLRLDKLELSLSTLTKQTVQLQDENQSATISYTQVGDQPCLREEHNVSRKAGHTSQYPEAQLHSLGLRHGTDKAYRHGYTSAYEKYLGPSRDMDVFQDILQGIHGDWSP